MPRHRPSKRLRRSVWMAVLAAAAAGGLVAAQPMVPLAPPTASPGNTPLTPQGAPGPAPKAPPQGAAPEEAPPLNVPAPAPMVVPPISDQEVAPAPPPAPKPQAQPEKPAEPLRRARYDVAIIEALDKVTAENLVFEAPVGKRIRYKGLIFTVSACERSTTEEAVEDSIAYLTIDSQPRAEPGRATPPPKQVFKGWMYAASPGLHPLEHPVYDAWVISCRQASPPTTVAAR